MSEAEGRKRRGGLTDLSTALEALLRSHGVAERLRNIDVYPAWREVVGEDTAGHTRILSFQKGVLRVAVSSAPLLAELKTFRLKEIRDGLDGILGPGKVREIRLGPG
jgi:predicted nucleic acid-binding Zn ribbon protein